MVPRTLLVAIAAAGLVALSGAAARPADPAALRADRSLHVLSANPRYFTDGSGRAVYLTGSHVWWNLLGQPHLEGRLRPRQGAAVPVPRLPGRSDPPRRELHPPLDDRADDLEAVRRDGRRAAAALPPHRAGPGAGRAAEVRPPAAEPGVLRPAAQPRARREAARRLRLGDALRGLGRAVPAQALARRVPPVLPREQRQRRRSRPRPQRDAPRALHDAHAAGAPVPGGLRAPRAADGRRLRQRPVRDRERERRLVRRLAVPHARPRSSGTRPGAASAIRSGSATSTATSPGRSSRAAARTGSRRTTRAISPTRRSPPAARS